MFEEDERHENNYESNHDNSKIIQSCSNKEKKHQNNNENIINEINEENCNNNESLDIETISKSHHSKKVSLDDINRISNSICKLSIPNIKGKIIMGTCFFMYIMNKKFLITNNHVISNNLIHNKKDITVINNDGEEFIIKLSKKERIKETIVKPYDISAIEILDNEKINNIKYLDYDYNDINKYKKKEIFILQHPKGKELHIASGTINNINKKIYEFEHNLDTDYGSSGSPVILIENCKVIGIHKKRNKDDDNKKGTFICKLVDKIINKLNKSLNSMNFKKNNINTNEFEENSLINSKESEKNNLNNTKKLEDSNLNNTNKFEENNLNGISNLEENNLIILKYRLDIENPILLFSKKFYYKNKNFLKIYINERKYELKKNSIKNDEIKINQNILEIKVAINEPICMSQMFCDCNSLESIRFIKCDRREGPMDRLFYNCKNLTEVFGIDEFEKVYDINNLFSGCTSLITLPKTLNWDTSEVEKMNEIFSDCESLTESPDISKWNTSNVIYMQYLFSNCKSLRNIPDIKNWDTSNVKNMSHMFHNCENIEILPDISFWNVSKVENLSNLFSNCKSLKKIPDISKWTTRNVKTMNNIFLFCSSVSSLPDISRWNTKNVTNMNCMFSYCENVKTLPDLSRLNTKRVENKRLIKPKKKKYDKADE